MKKSIKKLQRINKNELLVLWNKTLNKLSGNLTTNEYMPGKIKELLLDEDETLKYKISFKEMFFPELENPLNKIKGLNILAGLQNLKKERNITLYRAIRFPTYKRTYEVLSDKGCCVPNYEQERILELFKDEKYLSKRKQIQKDKNFWVQPQERVVSGLPVFILVNDALQIHRAFRNRKDKVVMIAIHIPNSLLENKRIKLIANSAIDLDYDNCDRDFEIKNFISNNGIIEVDYGLLRARGINLHEMYIPNLPWSIKECLDFGIEQEFFMLDIYEITKMGEIMQILNDPNSLKKNQFFLHGFFGDQNPFGRGEAKYLPYKCQKIICK